MRVSLLIIALLLALAAPAAAAPQLVDLGAFDRPLYVTSPPGDQRIFVVEKGGVIKLVGGGTFLDISAKVNGSDEERGLLSMAFSPSYASNGLFYVFYTEAGTGTLKVVEFQRSATDPSRANPTPRREFLSLPHGPEYHNGGQLQFGPDGMLYVSTGDGHDRDNAQDTSVPFGKILRLDPATGGAAAGNPHGLVWSYGLRNPWRFSFDRGTGDMIIGDVGESQWEEIDWAPAPTRGRNLNFGWGDCEGPDPSHTCGENPVVAHAHNPPDTFCAIVGGYVVRDPGLPTLNGRYIYGDNCNSAIWALTPRTGANDHKTGLTVSQLTSFGADSCGHLYAASLAGHVYRLQDGAVSPCTLNNGQPADTTPPTLNVAFSGVKKALRTHKLRVAMRCSEGCSITVGTRLKKVRTLKARHRDLAANRRAVVTLKLSKATVKKLRKRLKHHSSVRVSVAVRATDAAGNSKTVHRGGRIRRHR